MADRTSAPPTQPPQRDTMYCHQCENEWYRDEHGLTCPECHSDFCEVIEPDHDPREEHLPEEAPPPGLLGGGPGFYGVPDPDEEDIDNLGGARMRWERTPEGQMRGTFNRTYHFGGGAQPGQGQQDGGLGGGLMGLVGNILGGAFNNAMQQGQQQGGHPGPDHGQQLRPDDQRPLSPNRDDGSRAQSAPGQGRGGTNVRHFHGPFGHISIASSSSMNFGPGGLHPRDANNPQAPQQQPEGIDDLMRMMFNIGAMPPGGPGGMFGGPPGMMGGGMPMGGGGHAHPMMGGPFGGLFQLFGGMPMGGVHGDAVFSQEDLDRVITQLMEQHQSGNAPGPASESAIAALPKRKIEEKDLDENGRADCSICMDEAPLGVEVTVLPCSHWFHGECIKAWLGEHDTCPHCRQGIMPKEGGSEANRPRDPTQAPLHDMMNNPPPPPGPNNMPGGFPSAGNEGTESSQDPGYGGSQNRPMSGIHRRASSTGANDGRPSGQRLGSGSGGGIFQQMRNAFGGSNRGGSAPGQQGPGAGYSGGNPGS
ncbi:hypothetical protein D0863_04951 [Hortaea werneckii]|uniref:RING-type E3 ubiquitin transferase n=1 Tax=Hortaea werneckii TaxID=91943 RepID=A0A3M7E5C6_HORWE|nr:hypothetical protein D0863_04951 [Hortaea werneckii]